MIRSVVDRISGAIPGRILGCAVVAVLMFTAACDEGAEVPQGAQGTVVKCRQLMAHIFQITPRPGSDRPETDPAKIQELAAKVPVEDIEQCAGAKDAVIACMQAAGDFAALRACIPAQTE